MQRRAGHTGVSVTAVSQLVAHCMKPLLVGSIRICSHLAELFMQPYIAPVEPERMMITK